jgi:hypothetical protein
VNKKLWVAAPAVIAAPLALALCLSAAFKPTQTLTLSGAVNPVQGHAAAAPTASPRLATPTAPATTDPADSQAAAAVTPAPTPTPTFTPTPWATSFASFTSFPTPGAISPASDATTAPTSATPALTPAPWPTSAAATATSASATSGSAPSSTAAVPYAPALSSYDVLAQSYSATDIVNDGWAQDANVTGEGGGTCPVANASYSSALDAVVLTTGGQPATAATTDCAHIRSQYTVPTSGDVVEARIWLPSLSGAATVDGTSYPAGTLLDWTSMWTDGADSANGPENWPADTEVDAVETQYGANYVSVHYGSVAATGASTGVWTTAPQGWAPAGASYAAPNAGAANVQPGWNVVDIEFTPADANIYFNGQLFVTVPGGVLTHDPAYLNFGISGPNGNDPDYPMWPAGPATEDVQYVKVFS